MRGIPHSAALRANVTQEWLKENVPRFINKVDWPGNSPDLNPIENFWAILKRRVYANGGFRNVTAMKARVKKCIKEFEVKILENLVDSMVKRCALLKRDKGKKLDY